jgi:formylglycine-generating enzyme required for sulfatase activity
LDDEKVLILTVEREYMEVAEYRVTVLREEAVPTATGVEIRITPEIGAFFVGRGVIPEFQVTANLPAAGGELSYQWYMNTENSNRGGTRINEATGTTYTMKPYETMIVRTVYYYAEITNTIDGKTGVTESNPCRVVFLDINALDEKSRGTMVDIPAGNVSESDWANSGLFYTNPYLDNDWSTPGFSMGEYLVTYELWEIVFRHADAANYRFSNAGTQGARNNYLPFIPAGNELHPVTWISWRDMVVWCNAYSEMDGRQPVYVDSDGNVLRTSRTRVEDLIDETKMAGKNGYRLPTGEEWCYAAYGANPGNSSPWADRWPGTDDPAQVGKYVWFGDNDDPRTGNPLFTGTVEVGSLLPNSLGLYDMAMAFKLICAFNLYCGIREVLDVNYGNGYLVVEKSRRGYGSTTDGFDLSATPMIFTLRLVLDKEQ